MAFTTGTASSHKDLLAKLKDYLLAQGWTINLYDAGSTLADLAKLYVTGPGQAGGQKVNVSIQTDSAPAQNMYAWKVCGHTEYHADLPWLQQTYNGPAHWFNLWPNEMTYWFYVNDRRFIVVAKIGTYYMSMYAGFFLPFTLPAEYPFPYYIGGTRAYLTTYDQPDAGQRSFYDPGPGGASLLSRESLTWTTVQNARDGANALDSYWGSDNAGITWPMRAPMGEDDYQARDDIAWSQWRLLRPLLNGVMPLWQVLLYDTPNNEMVGALDGPFITGGFNRAPEQTITVGAKTYRLFINVGRNTPKHYFAIEEA